MPGAACHSFFWAGSADSGSNPSIGSSASGGYVPWQTTIIATMCLAARVSWGPSR